MEANTSQEPSKVPEIETDEFEDWFEEFTHLVRSGRDEEIVQQLSGSHYADFAEVLHELEYDEAFYVFRLFQAERQSEVLVELDEDYQSEFMERLQPKEISAIFELLESDDITFILASVSPSKAEEILKILDREDSQQIRVQMEFIENSAGRIMSSDFAAVYGTDTIRKAVSKIRKIAKVVDDIYTVYVIDQDGRLMGYLRLKELLLTNPSNKINKIMIGSPLSVHFNTDQEEVARMFRKYDLVSIAVVDDKDVMIGRITVDDVLDIVQEEASEDIYRMGGLSEDEKLNTPVFESLRKRILWLVVNLATAVLAASVVSLFEETIQKVVVLATLMPIVAGMGGNAGTQSITVVVRNLATGELTLNTWWEAVRKEISIGILNGLFLGILTSTMVYIFKGNLVLSFVIGSAMFVNLFIAGTIGSCIPLLLKILRIDPAIASSIFVTTFTDICGFFFFLGLAQYFLSYLN
ncbi:MAG: magnesium transporter [Leptospiraceae bacterium]|nr:magnesium transporter [Leptospiraceae bacterium]